MEKLKIGIISDIHANFEALFELADVLSSVDQVICLGDFVGYYCQVNEVIDYIRSLNPICIMGNHDYYLLNGYPSNTNPAVCFGIDYARKNISRSNLEWLESLPLVWGGLLGGRTFLLSHGSPWNPLRDYLYEDNPELEKLKMFSFDVIAVGQTHRVMQRMTEGALILNPGSIGQSRDIIACACAFVLDTESMSVERIIRPYNVNKTICLCRQNGAQEWVCKHLLPL